jgi:hypothetical protein
MTFIEGERNKKKPTYLFSSSSFFLGGGPGNIEKLLSAVPRHLYRRKRTTCGNLSPFSSHVGNLIYSEEEKRKKRKTRRSWFVKKENKNSSGLQGELITLDAGGESSSLQESQESGRLNNKTCSVCVVVVVVVVFEENLWGWRAKKDRSREMKGEHAQV